MGKKHANKRQKLEPPQPLGSRPSLLDDSTKDDEERRLESFLFGTKHAPPASNANHVLLISDDEDSVPSGGNELQTLLDTDLFFVDDVDAGPSNSILDHTVLSETSDHEDGGSEDADKSQEDASEDEEPDVTTAISSIPITRVGKAPAWTDPDDANVEVSLASNKRLWKLRDAASDDVVGGREYERRLRRQFEKINPTPEWANVARKKIHPSKRRRPSTSSASEEDIDQDEGGYSELLNSTGGILDRTKSKTLAKGTLAIERLRDANISARSEGIVKAVQFHPSPQLPILLTAGDDRRLRLFNVDGHSNPHLQTVHIPDLPLHSAMFHPSGSSVLLTGPRPYFYNYDLQSSTAQKSPRGLWGTSFDGANLAEGNMEKCAFNPTGEVLAVAGRRGYVHLVDWKSGSGQVVGSVKLNSGVKSLWWAGGSGAELLTLGDDSEVYVWNVGERRCIRRWKDDGGFGSQILSSDRTGRYLSVGSRHGIVNVYDVSSGVTEKPKLSKSIDNLTTSITSLRFNHDAQLLALASDSKKDQMRMVHLPSLTVFSNWPTSSTPLGHVTSIDFSARSEFIAVGNTRGRVLLYNLRDYVSQS